MSPLLLLLLAGQILHEPFDKPDSLERWERMDGAVTGDGPYSEASIDSGALLFEGDGTTRRWLALTRTVPLGDARWVRLSARLKTDGVAAEKAVYANCNLFFRFGDGPLVGTRCLTGTNDWTTVARRLPVPKGEKECTIGCFLSIPGRAWFDEVRIDAVAPPKWKTAKTKHYTYSWLPGDSILEHAREYNEGSYKIVSKYFGVTDPVVVTYFKYPDLDVKEEYTGIRGNAHRAGREIHSIWATDRHEIVHILCGGWGDPPALLGEGIAVYISGGWQNKTIPDAAREVARDGRWIPLAEILDTAAFRRHPDRDTYAISGAFVLWVADAHGKEKLRSLYGALKNGAPEAENRKAFEKVLGMDLAGADAKLRASLGVK